MRVKNDRDAYKRLFEAEDAVEKAMTTEIVLLSTYPVGNVWQVSNADNY